MTPPNLMGVMNPPFRLQTRDCMSFWAQAKGRKGKTGSEMFVPTDHQPWVKLGARDLVLFLAFELGVGRWLVVIVVAFKQGRSLLAHVWKKGGEFRDSQTLRVGVSHPVSAQVLSQRWLAGLPCWWLWGWPCGVAEATEEPCGGGGRSGSSKQWGPYSPCSLQIGKVRLSQPLTPLRLSVVLLTEIASWL